MINEGIYRLPRHPIRVVAQRTGLSPHVLRAWERRYRVVEPGRSVGGQRLYSDADIDRLALIVRATRAGGKRGGGRAVGQVAALPRGELERLVEEDAARGATGPPLAASYSERAWDAVARLAPDELFVVLRAAVLTLGAPVVVDEVIPALLRRVGDAWAEGRIRIAHEHAASAMVRRVVTWLIDGLEPAPGASTLVVATPAGERHELGAMLATAVAAHLGWRVTYLGPDLPALELVRAAREREAAAVALSLVSTETVSAVVPELSALRAALPAPVALLLGGRAAGSLPVVPDGITVVEHLGQWRGLLRKYSGPATAF